MRQRAPRLAGERILREAGMVSCESLGLYAIHARRRLWFAHCEEDACGSPWLVWV